MKARKQQQFAINIFGKNIEEKLDFKLWEDLDSDSTKLSV